MLDAGWNEVEIPSLAGIKEKKNSLFHPASRNQYPVSWDILHTNVLTEIDMNFKILAYEDI